MNEDQLVNNLLSKNADFFENLTGGLLIFVGIIFLIAIAALVVIIIGEVKLFKKAGKPGWAAIVPFYSTYVLVEIAGLNWWYFLIAISGTIINLLGISGLGTVTLIAARAVNFFIFYNLGKKFKQNPVTYGVLGIFFPGIIATVLGFSKNMQYDSSVVVSPNGPIDDKKGNTTTASSEPEKFCLGCGQKLKPGTSFCENCGKKVE